MRCSIHPQTSQRGLQQYLNQTNHKNQNKLILRQTNLSMSSTWVEVNRYPRFKYPFARFQWPSETPAHPETRLIDCNQSIGNDEYFGSVFGIRHSPPGHEKIPGFWYLLPLTGAQEWDGKIKSATLWKSSFRRVLDSSEYQPTDLAVFVPSDMLADATWKWHKTFWIVLVVVGSELVCFLRCEWHHQHHHHNLYYNENVREWLYVTCASLSASSFLHLRRTLMRCDEGTTFGLCTCYKMLSLYKYL